ncbi:MAG: ATP-dependent helicase [Candidatus Omnitrophica bacterium]|nr:ATP-dependent helicase [Candidatus Omnitrophota bacterium]
MKKYSLHVQPEAPEHSLDFESALNEEQVRVVREGDGYCLVLAGPGSGKTRTLVYRVANLIHSGVSSENILLVTFTNRAAREMLERVGLILKTRPRHLFGGTFHHIGNMLLRRHGVELGYTAQFGILDEEDAVDLVDTSMQDLGYKGNDKFFPKAKVASSMISLSRNCRRELASTIESHYPHFLDHTEALERIASEYRERKLKANVMDYDDLLERWLQLAVEHPGIGDQMRQQFRYVLVDEFQDTNRLQFELVRNLSSLHRNLLVVGDDAQSIYSFRGADIENILSFNQVYSQAKVFKLERNYRSTPEIVNLANESILNNTFQHPKDLSSMQQSGPAPVVVHVTDARQQALFVAQRLLELRGEGISLNHSAVLFRARYQSAELELELTRRGIPYSVRGGLRFFEQAHIKDVLAHLRLSVNTRDDVSWRRVLQMQAGVGKVTALKIGALAQAGPGDLKSLKNLPLPRGVSQVAKKAWSAVLKLLVELSENEGAKDPGAAIDKVLHSGYKKYVQERFENAEDRLEDLEQLSNLAGGYASVEEFLVDVTLREGFSGETMDGESVPEEEYVVLSTIHQAKGLEWDAVLIIGMAEGLFPHARALKDPRDIEEERRLFYVASTRARTHLHYTCPLLRFDREVGQVILRPSLFLEELPRECYEEWRTEETTQIQDEPVFRADI